MSTSAVMFFLAALALFAGAMLLPIGADYARLALDGGAAVFAGLFVLALVKGRRIKFDPLLR